MSVWVPGGLFVVVQVSHICHLWYVSQGKLGFAAVTNPQISMASYCESLFFSHVGPTVTGTASQGICSARGDPVTQAVSISWLCPRQGPMWLVIASAWN